MDTQLFTLYKSGFACMKIAEENVRKILNMADPKEKVREYSAYHETLEASKVIMDKSLALFMWLFPKDLSDFKDNELREFFSELKAHPEMLSWCENKFFSLVKQAVDPSHDNMKNISFSWYWADVYEILSSQKIVNYVQRYPSKEFEAMVYALALHLDPTNPQDKNCAVLFFSRLNQFEKQYPNIVKKSLDYLTRESNLYKHDWVDEILCRYEKKRE